MGGNCEIEEKISEIRKEIKSYGGEITYKADIPIDFPEVYKDQIVEILGLQKSLYELVGSGIKMYHKRYNYEGTCNLLLYDKIKKGFIICNWKLDEDFYKNYEKEKLLYPFEFHFNNPENIYEIQLSLYHMLLEQLGYRIISREICWLKRNGGYSINKCADLTEKLKVYLNSNLGKN